MASASHAAPIRLPRGKGRGTGATMRNLWGLQTAGALQPERMEATEGFYHIGLAVQNMQSGHSRPTRDRGGNSGAHKTAARGESTGVDN